MAPPTRTATGPDYMKEHAAFIAKLKVYHDKRGTRLELEPRVSQKQIDLLQLFNLVVGRGGYDRVSAEKLAWRVVWEELYKEKESNPASMAFQLKTLYYKNLAAYEITTIHGKEPPPKEILEETTARGGNLLTRTVENFRPTTNRHEASTLPDGMSGESGDDGTPIRDRAGSEDAPGSGGRATRGLRQAPPQRVLFQPDTLPARQSHRHTNTPTAPTQATTSSQATQKGPSTFHAPSNNLEPMSSTLANYEPRPPQAMTLKPVITPSSDPGGFAKQQRLLREAAATTDFNSAPAPRMMLPGTGFDGPNIYVRCLLALKSGIPAEQDYALHHLVKISMERGDKYRFESFAGLAEALIEKMLDVSSLFYEVDWQISYLDDGRMPSSHTLDGMEGTKDILLRIANLVRRDVDDNIQTEDFSDRLLQINEAALTLRNMVMLEENALYVSGIFPLRDFLSIALQLPNFESVVELKHYSLEIAEQLTKYLHFDPVDPLYLSLLAQLQSEDRGAILTSLRAISRISMNLEESNRLQGVPQATVQNIINWTLLDDEELVHASLDFLYQYTAVVDNVDFMITEIPVDALVNQLSRLLMYGARTTETHHILKPETRRPGPTSVPNVPRELLQELLKLEEPTRSSQWLRCLFEEDKEESITQIALWQTYQAHFSNTALPHPILAAADFIKNVSNTFADKATAQVQPASQGGKFIIKGIRIREAPVDLQGKEYTKCRWAAWIFGANNVQVETECEQYFMTQEQMYNHILLEHASIPRSEDGVFVNEPTSVTCRWKGCGKYPQPTIMKTAIYGGHIKGHVKQAIRTPSNKDSTSPNGIFDASASKKPKPSWIIPAVTQSVKWIETAVDERGDAAGIPLSAVLVLRNLARNLPKTEAEEVAMKDPGAVSYVDRLFKPIEPGLWYVFAHNKSLKTYLSDLLTTVHTPN